MGLNEVIKIGDNIKQRRKKIGLTQKEMAQKLGIPNSTYSNYENNNRTPSMSTLEAIADILDVPIPNLFSARQDDIYFEFVDIFASWAVDRNYRWNFSQDDSSYIKNNGGQSIIIFKDGKSIEFTPEDLNEYFEFLYNYFDAKLSIKEKNYET